MSLDNSWDTIGVNGLWLLSLSSSRKCEGGGEDRLENRASRITSTSKLPKTTPAMANPLMPDFPPPFPLLDELLLAWVFFELAPGGGGGACSDDQEFPPALDKANYMVRK